MGFLLGFFFVCMVLPLISASILPGPVKYLSFNESFSTLFGDQNLKSSDATVQISLTNSSGCGFKSRLLYYDAFFSASVKLPANNNTAGVVVAFYTTNSDVFNTNHDELDFEFLGNVPGKEWVVQTNFYGNESVKRGREERFTLWFDPTQGYHNYSLLWNENWTVFYVDDVPIRQVRRVDAMGGDYPRKPMSLYATIWDGSSWASSGGKHKINYRYAPFVADFTKFVIYGHGCSKDEIRACTEAETNFVTKFDGLTADERSRLKDVRKKFMIYSYCNDRHRYPIALPECVEIKHI